MRSIDFEKAGYLTKERLCGTSRTPLTTIIGGEEDFGVSIPNKVHGLYYNYLVRHSEQIESYSWKEIGDSLDHDGIFNVFFDKVLGTKKTQTWEVSVTFTPNESKLLENLRKTLWYYTPDSVFKALGSTPELAHFIHSFGTRNYMNKEIHSVETCVGTHLMIYHFNRGFTFPEIIEQEDSEALFSYARLISTQLRALSLDTSKLVKKPKEEPLLPKWLENTIKIGAKVGIKYLCATIGAKIDLPDWGGDNSNDVPDYDFGDGFGGSFDNGDGIDFGDDGFGFGDDGYDDGDDGFDIVGISFQGKHFDGFEDQHKQISVPIMGNNNSSAKLHVYKKLGSSTIYVSDGTCYPVSIAGHEWITVGSHKFDVSKIKSKL